MSRNIRVSEPSAEMQIKIIRAKDAIASQKPRTVRCPSPTQFNLELSCILHVSTDYPLMGSEPSKEKVKNDLLSIISELSTIAKKIRRYGVRKG